MQIISADEVDGLLTFEGLTATLEQAFRAGAVQPQRHHHTIRIPGAIDPTLLLMPAWTDFDNKDSAGEAGFLGVKIVTISPDNNSSGKPAVMGMYYLANGRTGEPLALIDGKRLTLWRTACASALAAKYLARSDASRLLIIGAGALAPFLARAHAAIRPISKVQVWNRTVENAEALVRSLSAQGLDSEVSSDLDEAVRNADIISSATISDRPLVKGRFLQPGTHVDLVGAFTPALRESDDDTISKSRIYCDTRQGAVSEAGDIIQPLRAGIITENDIIGDLYELTREEKKGRRDDDEITVFKSVGAAIEDLAAGIEVYRRKSGN